MKRRQNKAWFSGECENERSYNINIKYIITLKKACYKKKCIGNSKVIIIKNKTAYNYA